MRDDVYERMARHENAHWWFVGRRRILEDALAGLALPPGARILEVGAGTGGNLAMLGRFGAVTALEPNPQARAAIACKTGIDAIACALPDTAALAGRQFDLIAMFDVLEHIDDAVGALSALAEHLAPGGRFLVTVPAYQFLWSAHDESHHHLRRYTRASLAHTAAAAGLTVRRPRYFNTLLFPLVAAVRLAFNALGVKSANQDSMPEATVNRILTALFAAERHVVLAIPMPFGVSLLAVMEPPPRPALRG